jgi:leader peptidase (prepilin peptidase) / N-methyltransferase
VAPLYVAVVLLGLLLGPGLAVVGVRLATHDAAARPTLPRAALTTVLLAGLLAGAVALTGLRPATAAFGWLAGSALVLGTVDLISHRLPDVVTYPAYGVCGVALLTDAAALGTWPALLRGVLAGVAAFAVAALGAAASPEGLGFGDVKLLGLLGLVLGWAGWGVLLAGVFVGLLVGALVSLVLLATRRIGWRGALPFGPPLLVGAVVALAAAGPLP